MTSCRRQGNGSILLVPPSTRTAGKKFVPLEMCPWKRDVAAAAVAAMQSCHAAVLENIIGSRIGQCTDSRPAASASCSLKNQIHQQLLPPTSLPTKAGLGCEKGSCARNNNGHDGKVKRQLFSLSLSFFPAPAALSTFSSASHVPSNCSARLILLSFLLFLSLSFPLHNSTPLSLLR